jgi:hypothetical protein
MSHTRARFFLCPNLSQPAGDDGLLVGNSSKDQTRPSKNQRGLLVVDTPPEPEPEPPAARLATSVAWSSIYPRARGQRNRGPSAVGRQTRGRYRVEVTTAGRHNNDLYPRTRRHQFREAVKDIHSYEQEWVIMVFCKETDCISR